MVGECVAFTQGNDSLSQDVFVPAEDSSGAASATFGSGTIELLAGQGC